MKTCTKCKKSKSVDCFNKNKSCQDGLSCWCRACMRIVTQAWKLKNLERAARCSKQCAKAWRQTLFGRLTGRVSTIRGRCTNPNISSYKNYGARGITLQFTTRELYDWIMERDIDPDGKEIHRIDNDGDYALDNIEFLTQEEHIKAHCEPVPF